MRHIFVPLWIIRHKWDGMNDTWVPDTKSCDGPSIRCSILPPAPTSATTTTTRNSTPHIYNSKITQSYKSQCLFNCVYLCLLSHAFPTHQRTQRYWVLWVLVNPCSVFKIIFYIRNYMTDRIHHIKYELPFAILYKNTFYGKYNCQQIW